jgi:aryl-alcohol dehydrogenase-like predicted oxidoreductase
MGLRRRNLGKTGLTVSEMTLGTWGLSGDAYGPVEDGEQERVLARAIEMGFTLIDTADVYGAGRMERLVARAIAERDDVFVVTKGGTDRSTLPARKRFDPAYLRAAVERSLRRLGRDRIEIYLLHNPPVATVIRGEAIGALDEMKREGKIGHWGVSAGDVDVGRESLRRGAEVIEIAYNLFQGSDLHRLAGEVVVSGAGVLARSTLAHGLLAGHWGKNHEFAAGDHRADRWTKDELERRIDQLDALRFLLGRDVPTLSAAAVRFVLSSSIVSSAVLGPRSVVQLEDLVRNVGLGPVYLRDSELARLPRALEAVGVES